MADLYLDTVTHDLDLQDGDLVTINSTGLDATEIAQRVKIALLTQRGEDLFDVDLGLDFMGEIFARDPNIPKILASIRNYVSKIDGVTEIRNISIDRDLANRTATITLDLVGVNNIIITLE